MHKGAEVTALVFTGAGLTDEEQARFSAAMAQIRPPNDDPSWQVRRRGEQRGLAAALQAQRGLAAGVL